MHEDKVVSDTEYTLGLDIGIGSIGAALLADNHIMGLYVRTFDKAEAADGSSLNQERRGARSARRSIRRRRHRKQRLRRLLRKHGVTATTDASEIAQWPQPLVYRTEGLDRRLTTGEWAAAIYHIVGHRGFYSNRRAEVDDDGKDGAMLAGVNNNHALLHDKGWRTIGELLQRDPAFARAKRNKDGNYNLTIGREDLMDELTMLFATQRASGNPFASEALEHAVLALLMAQRPVSAGAELLDKVGYCSLEPAERRAPHKSHAAERFFWATKLVHLRIRALGNERGLTPDERKRLRDWPFHGTKSRLTYKTLRRLLELPDDARFNISYRTSDTKSNKNPEEQTCFEATGFHALRRAYQRAELEAAWRRDSHDPARLDLMAYAQTVFKDDDAARTWLSQNDVEPEVIEAVLTARMAGFASLSCKAMQRITPYVEQGQRYDEAVQSAGYAHHSQPLTHAKSHKLPPISGEEFRNPVVYRALNQARKVVNAIIDEHGAPASVHIEMARDLKKPYLERKRIEAGQARFRERKQADKQEFETLFGVPPAADELNKWRLYREQDGQCPYSGRAIDPNRLREPGYLQIDHALPWSRSFDNSMSNKVLVHVAENQNKGNQTPYEYLDGANDAPQWRRFFMFVRGNPKYYQAKRQKLLRTNFGHQSAQEFRERNLIDTSYIASAFHKHVQRHLRFSDASTSNRCAVVSGRLTGFLRARWGLSKVRKAGDKHHAMDAAVVAACNHSMVKRLSDYSRRAEIRYFREDTIDSETGEVLDVAAERMLDNQFPKPWPHFRQELQARLSDDPARHLANIPGYPGEWFMGVHPIRVSRPPNRRRKGAAHEATIRSTRCDRQDRSVVRTPLSKLKIKDLGNIVGADDPRNARLIELLHKRLEQYGNDGRKAFKEPVYRPSASGKTAPPIRRVKVVSTQKSGVGVRGGIANNGNMYRVDVFCDSNRYYLVPVYARDVAHGTLPDKAITLGKTENRVKESWVFCCCLYRNDWVRLKKKNKTVVEGYYKGMDRYGGSILIEAHDRRSSATSKAQTKHGTATAQRIEKLHVDILGRLYPARHQRRPLVEKHRDTENLVSAKCVR